jgi:NAD(P)-dependent dehydrogenase (short-subunit alcohol dehydrogenase family)
MGRVEGKTALVTGGGVGIGRACARLLADEGAKVAITQRHEDKAEAAVREIQDTGGQAMYIKQDVTLEKDWIRVMEEMQQTWGTPDILVNNAGIYIIQKLEETSLYQWHPMGHIGEPMDVAYAALYLASDESKFVTGAGLLVDGGFTAQ